MSPSPKIPVAAPRQEPIPKAPHPAVAQHPKFVARYGLDTPEYLEAAERSIRAIEANNIEIVRIGFPDQNGILRGKALTRDAYRSALEAGIEITIAPFFFDTANAIAFNPFTADGGLGDNSLGGSPNLKVVPDPTTFVVLPWAPETALVIGDIYRIDGEEFFLAPRTLLRNQLRRLAERNLKLVAGIEIEWYLTRILDDRLAGGFLGFPGSPAQTPLVAPVGRGYNYLLTDHLDEIDDFLRPLRKGLAGLGLPLRSIDDEWAPSQFEFSFDVQEGIHTADSAALVKLATKQIAKRNGYLATFMCTPAIEGFFGSGWHLHTSLADGTTGENVFIPGEGEALSEIGRHYVGGTLAHGVAGTVFSTPTVNGYRRHRPYSLAPDRLTWAQDNRAAMIRVISAAGDRASHVENRVGDPAANPYLFIASQVAAGLDGIENKIDPGPLSEDPYSEDVAKLPTSLEESVGILATDPFYRSTFGDAFIDYLVAIKRSEIGRYQKWLEENPDSSTYVNGVTEWEQREYFEIY